MAKKFQATPRGTLVYPRVNGQPDTKFDEAGIYKTGLRISADKAAPLVEIIDNAMQAAFKEAQKEAGSPMKAKKLKLADAPYSEEENGDIVFNFKMKHKITPKGKEAFTQKPAVVGADLTPIADTVRIGGGSEGKVSYDIRPYTLKNEVGVSLRLIGVQVLKLVEYSGRSAESMGFSAEEEEWSGDDAAESTEDISEESTADTSEEPEDF